MRRGSRKSSSNNKKGKATKPGSTAVHDQTGAPIAIGSQASTSSIPSPGMVSSISRVGSPLTAMRDLPALRDASPARREALFIQKLQLCGVIFSFEDPSSDKRGKDIKRQTLLELVDYVNTPAGQKNFYRKCHG